MERRAAVTLIPVGETSIGRTKLTTSVDTKLLSHVGRAEDRACKGSTTRIRWGEASNVSRGVLHRRNRVGGGCQIIHRRPADVPTNLGRVTVALLRTEVIGDDGNCIDRIERNAAIANVPSSCRRPCCVLQRTRLIASVGIHRIGRKGVCRRLDYVGVEAA